MFVSCYLAGYDESDEKLVEEENLGKQIGWKVDGKRGERSFLRKTKTAEIERKEQEKEEKERKQESGKQVFNPNYTILVIPFQLS